MAYSRNQDDTGLPPQVIRVLYGVPVLAHAAAVALLRRVIPFCGRVLRPVPWTCRFGASATTWAVLCISLGRAGFEGVVGALGLEPALVDVLREQGMDAAFGNLCALARVLGWFYFLAALAGFIRVRLALLLLKVAATSFTAVWAWVLVFIARVPAMLHEADAELFGKVQRNDLWMGGTALWTPVMLLALANLLWLALASVTNLYTRGGTTEATGDRVLRKLRPDAGDRRFRSSYYWSAFLHLSILFLIPLIIRGCGMMSPYGIPAGSGEPIQEVVKVKRIKKKKKDKVVLNMDSAILFYRPDLDDSKIFEEIQEDTLDTYQASSLTTGGVGKGGGKGGWPGGMANAKVRFIRLEYAGGDWDQQMGKGADYNFLIQFQKLTGFKIAGNTEHIAIRQLRRFPKHRGPPFVFLTGGGGMSIAGTDVKTLRWYCLEEGGLIFADNGGGHFNTSFRNVMRRAFPELEWVDIASDDVIFRQPYVFPNGAPPLWHHSGYRALGLKHQGRWIVFYHQGDLNDAWQTGHSGVSEAKAMQAYRLGVNVVNYAFNRYWEMHYQ